MTPDPEKLLDHSGWLRALARSLVRDDGEADDLVQDTWHKALSRPPRAAVPLGPWLARVLRNRAREKGRGAERRRRREEESALPERLPSARELCERVELQRALALEVLSLEEPYRSTLVLRYYEGLGAAEIAARLGVPAATVRARIARGLDRLRARMDARAGSREAWAALLAPGIGTASAGGAATLVLGVLSMGKAWKVGAAAVAFSSVVMIGLRAAGERAQPAGAPSGPSGAAVVALSAVEPAGEDLAAAPDVSLARTPVPAPPAAEDGESARHAGAESTKSALRVLARAVDDALVPLAGVRLEHYGSETHALSGPDGRIVLDLPDRGRIWMFAVRAPGRATAVVRATTPPAPLDVDLGDVVLLPGGAVAGRVLDPDGMPCAGAEIVVERPGVPLEQSVPFARRAGPRQVELTAQTRARDDGRFFLEGVEAGRVRVWARAEGTFWSLREGVLVRARETADIGDLRLDAAAPEDLVAGVVLTPAGEPLAGAGVSCAWRSVLGQRTFHAQSDAQGRFAFLALDGSPHEVRAHDRAGRWPTAQVERALPGEPDLVLRFRAARELAVEARSGETAIGAFELGVRVARESWFEGAWTEDGAAFFREPAEAFYLGVRADGFADALLGPFEPGELAERTTVDLAPVAGVFGRVAAGGVPVSGARAQLFALLQGASGRVHGFPARHMLYVRGEGWTDAGGAFRLTPHEEGDYLLRVEADGFAPTEIELLALDPLAGRGPLAVEITAGGRVEGRVRALPGREPGGTIVGAACGDAFPRFTHAAADGSFRFEHLTPGRWRVEAFAEDPRHEVISYGSEPMDWSPEAWSVVVVDGATTVLDLDLASLARSVVRGVLTVDGAPAAGWAVTLTDAELSEERAARSPTGFTGPDGAFRLEAPRAGAHRLAFRRAGDASGLGFTLDVALVEGELDASYALATGRLVGSGATPDAAGYDRIHLRWRGERGASLVLPVEPDAAGRFAFEAVPAGEVELVRFAGPPSESAATVLAAGRVAAGGEAFLRIE